MEKYGFVYIWYDRKHKRFYIGCRWGREDDGYVCSSSWMKQAYKHRPQDFKRRILKSNIHNRKELLEKEYYYLKQIKDDELGNRYYNINNHHFGHWSTTENSKLTVGQKISSSPNRAANIGKANSGKIRSEESRRKQGDSQRGKKRGPRCEETKRKISEANKGRKHSDEYKENCKNRQLGSKKSEETKLKISLSHKGKNHPMYGKTHSEESKRKMSESALKRHNINNRG